MLKMWLRSLKWADTPGVEHIVIMVGDPIPSIPMPDNIRFVRAQTEDGVRQSIGFYHNMGSQLANTEWIMKLDVDALPNEFFFKHLLPILESAPERRWFNAGMFYVNRVACENLLDRAPEILPYALYDRIVKNIGRTSASAYQLPAATNFICRREDYIRLGGCCQSFTGYGWEDYQQIYMLERYFRGNDPLPGIVDLSNVTKRCRDEISRPRANELYTRHPSLALLHHWHPGSKDQTYKSPDIIDRNRKILLEYIEQRRLVTNCIMS